MPVGDPGTPSPHEGSICCEKETDRFSICYGDDVSVRHEQSKGNDSRAARIRPRHRHNLGRLRRDRPRCRARHRTHPSSRRANLPGSPRSEGRAAEPGAAAGASSSPSITPPARAPALARRPAVRRGAYSRSGGSRRVKDESPMKLVPEDLRRERVCTSSLSRRHSEAGTGRSSIWPSAGTSRVRDYRPDYLTMPMAHPDRSRTTSCRSSAREEPVQASKMPRQVHSCLAWRNADRTSANAASTSRGRLWRTSLTMSWGRQPFRGISGSKFAARSSAERSGLLAHEHARRTCRFVPSASACARRAPGSFTRKGGCWRS